MTNNGILRQSLGGEVIYFSAALFCSRLGLTVLLESLRYENFKKGAIRINYCYKKIPSPIPMCSVYPCSLLSTSFRLSILYLSGTFCHKTGTRPPSCVIPRQPTIHEATKNPLHVLSPNFMSKLIIIKNPISRII